MIKTVIDAVVKNTLRTIKKYPFTTTIPKSHYIDISNMDVSEIIKTIKDNNIPDYAILEGDEDDRDEFSLSWRTQQALPQDEIDKRKINVFNNLISSSINDTLNNLGYRKKHAFGPNMPRVYKENVDLEALYNHYETNYKKL